MDTTRNCEWVRERIDAYLDDGGEGLAAADRHLVEAHAAGCRECREEIELALRCRDAFANMPAFQVPEHVVAAAARAIEAAPHDNVVALPARARPRVRVWVGVVAAGLVVCAALAVWQSASRRATENTPAFSEADADAATLEAALALAYLGKYTQRTETILRDDVIGLRIVHPMQRAFVTSREAVVDDAVVPGIQRALDASGLGATPEPSTRS